MSRAVRSEVSPDPKPASSRRTRLVVLAFLLSRALVLLLVLNPDSYPHGPDIAADRDGLYRSWSTQVLDEGEAPYSETDIEYPPGALPFLVLPGIFGTTVGTYRLVFVLMMAVIDLLGLIACLRLAKRWQSPTAPWLWVILVGVLGPIAYSRFDLVPAVMSAWAIERAAYGRWGWAGAWMSAGAVAKVYPFLLLPLMFISSPNRRRVAWASVAVAVATALPVLTALDDVWRDVGRYHLSRGIHVESLWGSILFIASRQGLASQLEFGAGALHFTGNVAEGLRFVCDLGVLAVMAAGIYVTARLPRGDVRMMSAAMLGTLCLAMVASPVLSPQFILWVVPLGVAAVAAEPSRSLPLLLTGIAVATAAIFPFLYSELASGAPLPVILLWGRNLALLWVGLSVLLRAWSARINATAAAPA
jgi:hypothetical protein